MHNGIDRLSGSLRGAGALPQGGRHGDPDHQCAAIRRGGRRASSTGFGVPHDAYDAITSSGDVTRGIVEAGSARRVFHLGPERDLSIFAGLDVTFAPPETRRLRGVLRAVRRHDGDAGQLSRHCWRTMRGAIVVHGLRQSGRRGRARRYAGLLRRRHRRRLRGTGRRSALLRQAACADLRRGAGQGCGGARRHVAGAQARARDRRFGAHRSQRRRGLRARFPVRDLRHSRRGTTARAKRPIWRRSTRFSPPPRSRRRRSCANLSGEASAAVSAAQGVRDGRSTAGSVCSTAGIGFSANTASIFVLSVCALNGLTM